MARPLRIQFAGARYHVRARGNNRESVFEDDADAEQFTARLSAVAVRLEWDVLAYCLMPNHYHLLVHTTTPNLARGMRDLNGAYSQQFNRRRDRVGHVFEGRYRSTVVDRFAYLLEVARYVVLNPVRAGLCAVPEAWPWSSYRASIGLSPPWPGLNDDEILTCFGDVSSIARARYVEFVRSRLGDSVVNGPGATASLFGGPDFARDVEGNLNVTTSEVPRVARRLRSLADYVRISAGRDDAIRRAHASGLFSLKEIGQHFGLHYSSVGHIVRGGRRRRGNSRRRRLSWQDLTPGAVLTPDAVPPDAD